MQRSLHMRPLWMLSILVIIIIELSSAGCTNPAIQNASNNQTIDGITLPPTTGSPTPAEARQIAAAAYVFGYPLVFMDVWKDHQTAVPSPDLTRGVAPINQLVRLYQTPPTAATGVSASYPNVDFSNIVAWLNLTQEPMVLSVPASNGRYYVVQMADAWMNDFSSLGSRTTGNESDAFLDNVTLTPLSAWGTNYTPPTNVPVNPSVNGTDLTAPASAAQVANMTPDVFYSRMATLMGGNPPHSADTPVIDQIARIGIIPGKPFAWNGLNATMQDAIN